MNVGSGGGAAAPAAGGAAAAGGDGDAPAAKEEEKEEGRTKRPVTGLHNANAPGYREGGVGRGHGLRSVRLKLKELHGWPLCVFTGGSSMALLISEILFKEQSMIPKHRPFLHDHCCYIDRLILLYDCLIQQPQHSPDALLCLFYSNGCRPRRSAVYTELHKDCDILDQCTWSDQFRQ